MSPTRSIASRNASASISNAAICPRSTVSASMPLSVPTLSLATWPSDRLSVVPPMPPIMSRSCVSRYFAMSHPLLSLPTRLAFGTSTSSKKVWQKGDAPEIRVIGLVETPGLSMSNRTKLMPSCLGAFGSVRTRQKIQSALSAYEVQIFEPLTRKLSPLSSARVCSEARLEPDPGSEYPWHHRISPRAIFGRCSRFCSSLPYFSSAGPSIQMPKLSSGERHPSAAISWRRIFASSRESPPPPYSRGHSGTVQPLAAMRSIHCFCASDLKVTRRPPQQVSSSPTGGLRISGGQLASSHARVSVLKVSRSLIARIRSLSMVAVVGKHYGYVTKRSVAAFDELKFLFYIFNLRRVGLGDFSTLSPTLSRTERTISSLTRNPN